MPTESDNTPIPPTQLEYAPFAAGRWANRLLTVLAVGAAAVMAWYGWLYFRWYGNSDPSAYLLLCGRRFPTVTKFAIQAGMDADAWVTELSRPDTGLKALDNLYLTQTHCSTES